MSDEDNQTIRHLFAKKSNKPSNLNGDDQPISQLFWKKSGNLKEDDQGKLSKKSPKKLNRNMAFARAKNPKRNVLQGKMLEFTEDHETRQVFVKKKMVPANFVGNNLVLQVDQDIDCPCCLKKTSVEGLYSHSRLCYLYCYKYDKLEQFKRFTGAKDKYMKTYNKFEKDVEKAEVKYLDNKNTNPFGEAPLRIPDTSVRSILCYTVLYYNFLFYIKIISPLLAAVASYFSRLQPPFFVPRA
jgi:hypothetical protein